MCWTRTKSKTNVKGADDEAESDANHHNNFVLVNVEALFPAAGRFLAEQEHDVGCQGGEQPVVPHCRVQLPCAYSLHFVIAWLGP